MKILLAGGGTLGSVSPLIAIWQKLKEKDKGIEFLFVGTKNGLEKSFVNHYQIPYRTICNGKFRRYFSLYNLLDLFKLIFSTFQSFNLLRKFKPKVIISAGSFVAVPLILASVFSKTKVILYQSDLKVGLANKLCQFRANYIFTAFKETVKFFSSNKAAYLGSILRQEIYRLENPDSLKEKPMILVLGGGTGSQKINELIIESLDKLTKKYRIVHVTGRDKKSKIPNTKYQINNNDQNFNYRNFELLTDNYYQLMSEADMVISRAGLSTLMELSYLAKPVILIPLPNTIQEQNAEYFCRENAAICLNQKTLTAEILIKKISELISNQEQIQTLSRNIYQIFQHYGEIKIADIIYGLKSI